MRAFAFLLCMFPLITIDSLAQAIKSGIRIKDPNGGFEVSAHLPRFAHKYMIVANIRHHDYPHA